MKGKNAKGAKGNKVMGPSKNGKYFAGKATTTAKNRDGMGKPGGLPAPKGTKAKRSK